VVAAAPVAPTGGGGPDLGELWQQILAGLELPSTRMLLAQQAQLVRLDERRAVVRVSGTWMAMVQSRLPLLEKAVASALGSARQLQLETGGDPPAGERPSAVTPLEPVIPAPTIPAESPLPAPPLPPPPSPTPPAPAPPSIAAKPAPSPVGGPAAPSPLEEQARRLADFFNGEVIEGLEDEVA
jgi:DNA polymerase-3 subunit gamma/tau